jgi:DNA polymerase-1
MRPLALLDGDIYAVQSALKGQETHDFGEVVAQTVNIEHAIANLKARIKTTLDALETDRLLVCLSDPSRHYFRHDIEPTYKGNRTGEPPILLGEIKAYLREHYNIAEKPTLEADDVMGILQTKLDNTIIVSCDKDMRQIPGRHLNCDKIDEGTFEVTEEGGDEWHLMQTLMGDMVDGYPGRKGTGIKKAAKIVPDGWDAIVEDFAKIDKDEEFALKQARLAKILRVEDWDSEKQEVILWEPKR